VLIRDISRQRRLMSIVQSMNQTITFWLFTIKCFSVYSYYYLLALNWSITQLRQLDAHNNMYDTQPRRSALKYC